MTEVHLDEENIGFMTWSLHNIDCNCEHVMHKFLNSYPLLPHGWEMLSSLMCLGNAKFAHVFVSTCLCI